MKVQEFYKDAKGDSVQSLGWGSEQAQHKRFAIFAEYIKDGSVLDVGCGYGDFTQYVKSEEYLGIDERKEAISVAQKRYNQHLFSTMDLSQVDLKFDWVVASGIFCFECDERKILSQMFERCKIGVAVNFLYNVKELRSYDLTQIDSMARQLTNKFSIRHDYLPNDTTLILYK